MNKKSDIKVNGNMKNFELKEKLRSMGNDELYSLVLEIAKLRKENSEWLQAKLKGESGINETLEYYKKKINEALEDDRIKLIDAKKAISDFRKISKNPAHIIELMIFYVEKGIDIENEFGDLYESFYASMESVFENAVKMLNANPEFISAYRKRLISIVDRSTDGWGHKDSLSDILENLNSIQEAK